MKVRSVAKVLTGLLIWDCLAVLAAECQRLHDAGFPLPVIRTLPSGTWSHFRGDVTQDATVDEVIGVYHQTARTFELHSVIPDGSGGLTISSIVDFGTPPSGPATPFFGDVNGDGRVDIVLPQNANARFPAQTLVALGTESRTFAPPQPWTFPTYYENVSRSQLADIDGDGVAEFIRRTTGWIHAFRSDRGQNQVWSQAVAVSIPVELDNMEFNQVGDVDGDGVFDLIWSRTTPVGELFVFYGDIAAPLADWRRYRLPRLGVMNAFDQDGDGRAELLLDSYRAPYELELHAITSDRQELNELWRQSLGPEERWSYLQAIHDVNQDGLPDALVASQVINQGIKQQQVFLNTGRGPLIPGFKFRTNRNLRFFADLDSDRLIDAVFLDNAYGVFRGTGSGEFDEELVFRPGEPADQLLAGDFDQDGFTDLMAWRELPRTDPTTEPLNLRRGLGDGRFQTMAQVPPAGGLAATLGASYELADIDSNGLLDIVARVGFEPPRTEIQVAYARAPFQFESWRVYRVPIVPRRLGIGDFDGDGSNDLLVSNELRSILRRPAVVPIMIRGKNWSIRTPIELGPEGWWSHAAALMDVDLDRRADIVYASAEDGVAPRVWIRRSGSAGSFEDPVALWTAANPQRIEMLDIRDLDHDGIEDLLLQTDAPYTAEPEKFPRLRVLKGTGRLQLQTLFRDPDPGYRFLSWVSDIDRDGQFDLVSTRWPSLRLGLGDGSFGDWQRAWFEIPSFLSQEGAFLEADSRQWISVRQIGGEWWYLFSQRRGSTLVADQAPPEVEIALEPATTTDGSPFGFDGRWRIATQLRDECDAAPFGTVLLETVVADAPVLFIASPIDEIRVYRFTMSDQHQIVLRGSDEAASRARLGAIAVCGGITLERGQELAMRAHRSVGPSADSLDDPLEPAANWVLVERFRFERGRLDEAVRYQPETADLVFRLIGRDAAGRESVRRASWWSALTAWCAATPDSLVCETD